MRRWSGSLAAHVDEANAPSATPRSSASQLFHPPPPVWLTVASALVAPSVNAPARIEYARVAPPLRMCFGVFAERDGHQPFAADAGARGGRAEGVVVGAGVIASARIIRRRGQNQRGEIACLKLNRPDQ